MRTIFVIVFIIIVIVIIGVIVVIIIMIIIIVVVIVRSVQDILAAAARGKDKKSKLLFLPHLDGERSPYWNGNAQGVFLGITSDTGFDEMARLLLLLFIFIF